MNAIKPNTLGGLSPQTLSHVSRVLRHHASIDQAYLFGSRAKGDFRPGSDVDIAVRGTLLYSELLQIRSELSDTPTPYFYDVVALDSADPSLRAHVDRVGIPLLSGR